MHIAYVAPAQSHCALPDSRNFLRFFANVIALEKTLGMIATLPPLSDQVARASPAGLAVSEKGLLRTVLNEMRGDPISSAPARKFLRGQAHLTPTSPGGAGEKRRSANVSIITHVASRFDQA